MKVFDMAILVDILYHLVISITAASATGEKGWKISVVISGILFVWNILVGIPNLGNL